MIVAVDEQLSGASAHWSVGRMARVDRNILRIAVYEMIAIDEIPFNVTINEAIEIAKRFGTHDSPTFVNGVLDHILKGLQQTKDKVAAG